MKNRKIHSPPFAGIPTFAKFPTFNPEKKKSNDKVYGIVGIPYDMGTTDYPGARLAPRKIREASTQFAYTSSEGFYGLSNSKRGFYNIEEKKWTFKEKECFDIGDIEVVAGEPAKTFDLIKDSASYLLSKNIIPLFLGGDHAISYPILQAFKNVSNITILHFDAHMDYWNPSHNSNYDHSCSMWNISRLKNISHIYQFGIRGLNHKPEMLADAFKNKVLTYTAKEIFENIENVKKSLLMTKNVYISFDIDFFDPSIAPGTGAREIGGPNYQQAIQLIRDVVKFTNLVGMDLVEVNPLLDTSGITSLLAARLLLEIVGIYN